MEDNRKVFIFWRNNESSFRAINKDVVPDEPLIIGSSVSGVNAMLANGMEQQAIMPSIIGVSSNDPKWGSIIKDYWNRLRVEVPVGGRELNVGFSYDITAPDKVASIASINATIISEKGKLTKDEDLKKYIDNQLDAIDKLYNSKMEQASKLTNERDRVLAENDAYRVKWDAIFDVESERFKVGKPLEPFDFMLYKYCLKYGHVANDFSAVNNSPNIRFYLHSEADIARFKQKKLTSERKRMELYLDAIKNISKIENILYAMGVEDIPEDNTDKILILEDKSRSEASKFIKVASNKNIETIGLIEKYIAKGVLYRVNGTSIITDTLDKTKIIGNNMDDAIVYFANKENKGEISDFEVRYKELTK